MEQQDSTLGLKLLAVLGAFAGIAILSLPLVLTFVALRAFMGPSAPSVPSQVATSTSIGLGELGSTCGGPSRLPCKPGSVCSTENTGDLGTCVASAPSTSAPAAVAGLSCASAACGDGYYCKKSDLTCAKIDDASPYANSVKIVGATFENDVYHVAIGAKVSVAVKAVNAALVTMELVPEAGYGVAGVSQWLGQPKKGTGGSYTADLKIPSEFIGKLRVTVTSKNGDASVVGVDIATTK